MAERGGLPWYQIWTEFSRHGKTRDLCGRLRDRNAGMYVIRLWEHCAEFALDGKLAIHAIEEAADWRGKDGVLLAALEASGWLEVGADRDVRVLHGWEERNGARIREWQRENAKRKPVKNPAGRRRGPAPEPTQEPRENHPENPAGFSPGFPEETPTEPRGEPRRTDGRSETSRNETTPPPARGRARRHKLDPEAQQGDPPADAGGDRPRADSGPTPTTETVATTPPVPRPGREAPIPVSVATPPAVGPSQASTPPTPPPAAGKTSSARAVAQVEQLRPRRSEAVAARFPATAQLLDELERRGFEAAFPVDDISRGAVERAVAKVGVPVAADRVMAKVNTDRALDVVTRPWLGWLLDEIAGQPRKPVGLDIAFGVPAAPPEPDPGCADWASAREVVRKRVRPDLWDRYFRDLVGRMDGDVLVLSVGSDEYRRTFTEDNYAGFLQEVAGRPVRIEATAPAAAGGA